MKNILLLLTISFLAAACWDLSEVYTECRFLVKGTENTESAVVGYDTLYYRMEQEDSSLFVRLYFHIDSSEAIEELKFQIFEVDTAGNRIPSFTEKTVSYICISNSGDGAPDEQQLSTKSGRIIFGSLPDSTLHKMKEKEANALAFHYLHNDSVPSFIHTSLTVITRREGKRKTYFHEADFEKRYLQFHGGGAGKYFCARRRAGAMKKRTYLSAL